MKQETKISFVGLLEAMQFFVDLSLAYKKLLECPFLSQRHFWATLIFSRFWPTRKPPPHVAATTAPMALRLTVTVLIYFAKKGNLLCGLLGGWCVFLLVQYNAQILQGIYF